MRDPRFAKDAPLRTPVTQVSPWAAGIKASIGKLVCFTDDDAIWNSYFLKYLLAPFNDDEMGGTGSNQIMRPCRMDVPPTTFERIGDMRLSSRMLEAAASTFYDGSVSCLSGRTALYHKRILTPLEAFEADFCNEYWLKCAPLCSRRCVPCDQQHMACQNDDGLVNRGAAREGDGRAPSLHRGPRRLRRCARGVTVLRAGPSS